MSIIDRGTVAAYSFVFITIIFFVRFALVIIKLSLYIRKHNREYWDNNFFLFFPGGRSSISQLTKGLNDPRIEEFKKKEQRALKQLIFVVVGMFLLFILLAVLKFI
jgi:hypothetical protein